MLSHLVSLLLCLLQSSHLCTLLSTLLFLPLQSWAKFGELPGVPFPGIGAGRGHPGLLPTHRGIAQPECLSNSDLCFLYTPVSSLAPGSCHLAQGRQIQALAPRQQYLSPGVPASLHWLSRAWDAHCFLSRNSAHFLLPISFCSRFSLSLEEKCDSNCSCAMPGTRMASCFQLPACCSDLWNFMAPCHRPPFFPASV